MLELDISGRGWHQPVLGAIVTTVNRGDRVCLLGPSGVGKTTLLNAIAGLDRNPIKATARSSQSVRIGYLFQEHRLLPWRSLHQNLRIVGATDGEADRLLAAVGLTGYGHHFPDQVSLGMARRAALARAMAVKPDLLLLDEPFASLDPIRAGELRQLILDLLAQYPHMGLVCVTHDARDAAELATRLWYLNGEPARLQWDAPVTAGDDVRKIVENLIMPERGG
ncbi:ATP-binding cassette domain-containing protein [Marinobacter sp.]|uniref:ATP-binding cassette domain-containing protein n=1 Tax=Marinobacter sp. TaxID=50741 RepID=UPI002352FEA2|nr:ATP-binding cassette domain-containing protein [Marinobacter sp.]